MDSIIDAIDARHDKHAKCKIPHKCF